MAHVYNGVGSQYATSVVIPDDGDKVTATRANVGDGPVNPGLKQGMDNSTWLLTNEQSVPPGITRGSAYSTDGTTISISALTQYIVSTAGVWYTLTNASNSVTPATVLGSALANSTRYYLYYGQSGYNVSTTAPDDHQAYKTGSSSSLAFITTFITSAAGIIVPFCDNFAARRYHYLSTAGFGTTVLKVVTASAVVNAWTAITPGIAYPSAALEGMFCFQLVLNGAVNGSGCDMSTGTLTATGWVGDDIVSTWQDSGRVQTMGTEVVQGNHRIGMVSGITPKFYSTQVGGAGTTTTNIICVGFCY